MSVVPDDVIIIVRRALRAQLLTVDGLPGETLANADDVRQWDGIVNFTAPSDGTAWFRETMLRQPGPPATVSVGTNARLRHTGGWQISLFYPPDTDGDVYDIEAMAGAIRAAFPHSLDLPIPPGANVQRLRVLGCGIGTVTKDTSQARPMLHCPVRVNWEADTLNPI